MKVKLYKHRLLGYPQAVIAMSLACGLLIGVPSVTLADSAASIRAVPLIGTWIGETQRIILEDIAKINPWLVAHGFTVQVSPSRITVAASSITHARTQLFRVALARPPWRA